MLNEQINFVALIKLALKSFPWMCAVIDFMHV